MKVFKKEKRHLSKYKKAKPTIRQSITRSKILGWQEIQVNNMMKRREERTKRRADRVERLGPNLIKAVEWGYMRKHLHKSTKHNLSKEKKLEKQKEIAESWAEGRSWKEVGL